MENQASFDLNTAVQRWRAELAKSSSFRADDLDELESHVRDSEASLRALGLTSEEAFLIAVRRTGAGDVIAAEFATVNRSSIWQDRLLWITAGWILTSLLLAPVQMLLELTAITQFLPVVFALALSLWLQANLVRKSLRAPLRLASILVFVTLVSVWLQISLDNSWLAATVQFGVSASGLALLAFQRLRRRPELRQ